MEIVKCQGITKEYGSGGALVKALRGIDLSVERGAFVALTGASGSGKSTLLYILGGVEKPTSGTAVVDGQDVSAMSRAQAALFRRRSASLVYQFYNLVPTLTLRRNILLPLALDRRKPEAGAFERVVNALGIADRLDALPGQLSGGQQQRAAVARSLVSRSALLLADEPTGSLDRENTDELLRLLRQANQDFGQTIVLATHDQRVASEADRVITLADGSVADDRRR